MCFIAILHIEWTNTGKFLYFFVIFPLVFTLFVSFLCVEINLLPINEKNYGQALWRNY